MPRPCYNCGPGSPHQDDERFLCERCSTLYEFSPIGAMRVKRFTEPRAVLMQSPWTPEMVEAAAAWLRIYHPGQANAGFAAAMLIDYAATLRKP